MGDAVVDDVHDDGGEELAGFEAGVGELAGGVVDPGGVAVEEAGAVVEGPAAPYVVFDLGGDVDDPLAGGALVVDGPAFPRTSWCGGDAVDSVGCFACND